MIERMKFTENEIKKLLKSVTILIDTREKKNDHITDYFDRHKIPYKRATLQYGDYSFMVPADEELDIPRDISFEKEIVIERKNSAEELSGCFTSTRNRFEDEFLKGKDAKKYLIVENNNYSDIVNGDYNTHYNPKSFLASLHSFEHRFDLRIIFMPDRRYTPIYLYGVFQYYLRSVVK